MQFVELRPYNRVRNKLRRLASEQEELLDPGMYEFAQYLRLVLKQEPYPPPPPGSSYTRTGRLANGWAVVARGVSHYGIISRTPYVDYVVGYQAWMHKGRWWQARKVAQREIPQLTKTLTKQLIAFWTG